VRDGDALASLSGGEAWQIMLLEVINMDLNRIAVISDARATFLLFPSLSSGFTRRSTECMAPVCTHQQLLACWSRIIAAVCAQT